jgi:hypothetical protein
LLRGGHIEIAMDAVAAYVRDEGIGSTEAPMRGDDDKIEADELRASLGKELRNLFSDFAEEPLPPRLAHLVSRLDDPPPAGGASARPARIEYLELDAFANERRAGGQCNRGEEGAAGRSPLASAEFCAAPSTGGAPHPDRVVRLAAEVGTPCAKARYGERVRMPLLRAHGRLADERPQGAEVVEREREG